MGFIQWCDFRVWTTCSSICGNKSVGECKPSARRPVRPASLSSTSSGQAGCIVGLLCDSRQPWMFVMRPIIHSICSVSAESLHCSPTIEPWGAFNPSTSRAGRRPFCDIMHSSNTLSESANQPSLPSWLQLLQVCWWRGCWHGCISARWVGMKEFQRGKQSHHFLFQPADLKGCHTFTADVITVSYYFLTLTINVTRLWEILHGSRGLLCFCEDWRCLCSSYTVHSTSQRASGVVIVPLEECCLWSPALWRGHTG